MRPVFVGGCLLLAAAGVAAVLLSVGLMSMVMMTGSAPASTATSSVTSCLLHPSGGSVADLDPAQVHNARRIISIGKTVNVPPRGWVVAISAAMQESNLRNVTYGDRDSLGLMQQRPSQGWGSPAEVTSPTYAIRAFYGGPQSPTPNSGLLDIAGWQQMSVWSAAQSVQGSAYPFAYADHEATASALVKKLGHTTAGCDNLAPGPWTLPVHGDYVLTSDFGLRTSPTEGVVESHTGQDFAIPTGTPVQATSTGRVSYVGFDADGYGNLVRIRHVGGVETYYAHLSEVLVSVGQKVKAGRRIGSVGSTGNSTGPHLHLEVRVNDQPHDPMTWLRHKGVDL
jgi:murein DD-endopeptidase MepM/ murein hydrolase activator NlpD